MCLWSGWSIVELLIINLHSFCNVQRLIFINNLIARYSEEGDLSVLFNLYYLDKKSATDAENMTTIIIDKINNIPVDGSKARKSKAVNVFEGLIIDPASVRIKGTTYKLLRLRITYTLMCFKELKDKTEGSSSSSSSPGLNDLTKFNGRYRTRGTECVPVSLSFCRHLSHNLTSSPNLLGHQRKRDHDRLYEAAQ